MHTVFAARARAGFRPAPGILCVTLAGILCTAGCAVTFKEDHYFQQQNKAGDVTNYYRLQVSGYGALSSARYVSGFYDERAVDLFFNELKVEQTGTSTDKTLFKDAQKNPGSDETIKPLDPGAHGAFVMILSTNASSVARTIGQFSENQIVADAITNLMNRDALLSKAERNPHRNQQRQCDGYRTGPADGVREHRRNH